MAPVAPVAPVCDLASFTCWEAAAESRAEVVSDRLVSAFMVAHRERIDVANRSARAWIESRANELCGAVVFGADDLFGAGPAEDDWRSCAIPEQRLARFASDPLQTPLRRRQAGDLLSNFRDMSPDRGELPPRSLRMLGLLMLVP